MSTFQNINSIVQRAVSQSRLYIENAVSLEEEEADSLRADIINDEYEDGTLERNLFIQVFDACIDYYIESEDSDYED